MPDRLLSSILLCRTHRTLKIVLAFTCSSLNKRLGFMLSMFAAAKAWEWVSESTPRTWNS